jgi:predicted nucleotidyltransferase
MAILRYNFYGCYMRLADLSHYKERIYSIAAKYRIKQVYVFGSVARGMGDEKSDVDFLIEMEDGASALGVGGFQYEVQQLLGIPVDVVPAYLLPRIDDRDFVINVENEAVAI